MSGCVLGVCTVCLGVSLNVKQTRTLQGASPASARALAFQGLGECLGVGEGCVAWRACCYEAAAKYGAQTGARGCSHRGGSSVQHRCAGFPLSGDQGGGGDRKCGDGQHSSGHVLRSAKG